MYSTGGSCTSLLVQSMPRPNKRFCSAGENWLFPKVGVIDIFERLLKLFTKQLDFFELHMEDEMWLECKTALDYIKPEKW